MFLNCHTYYSLRYGTLKINELLKSGQENAAVSMALTDVNSTSACLEFVRLSSEYNIKPILGVDFRNGAKQQFIMLAENNEGFYNINIYLSEFLQKQSEDKTVEIPSKAKQLPNTFVIYPFASFETDTLSENEFMGVKIDDLNRLKFSPCKNRHNKLVVLQTVTFQN